MEERFDFVKSEVANNTFYYLTHNGELMVGFFATHANSDAQQITACIEMILDANNALFERKSFQNIDDAKNWLIRVGKNYK